jgi:hypothetical protein
MRRRFGTLFLVQVAVNVPKKSVVTGTFGTKGLHKATT